MNQPVLYLIIPCFNEEKVILTTAEIVTKKLNGFIDSGLVSTESRICLVDDGSSDKTWDLLLELYETNDKIVVLRHNRNYGEQYAYLTGIRFAVSRADCMITMDADLQDDVNAADVMLDEYLKGSDVVYGVRGTRIQDSIFQRATSALFYRFMRLCGTKLVPEHSQYRLMSRAAAQTILDHCELKVFLPALVPLLNFRESIVYYDRKPRAAGESHYNVRSLSRMAENAILSYGTYMPYFLLWCAVIDAILGLMCLYLFRFGDHPQTCKTAALLFFIGAVLLTVLFVIVKTAMRRHLSAKNRPKQKSRR